MKIQSLTTFFSYGILTELVEKLGAAIEDRFACKSFLPDAVPEKTLREMLKLTLVRTAAQDLPTKHRLHCSHCSRRDLERDATRNRMLACSCVRRGTARS
ncbi:hypothetical protein PsorP6_002125 [Peronosclerospora sorghi]|uniref:Uncharacterized protein n=1 Tax=Peronosclerospora sorghi TaxID=230839 RepID=A0ACC0WSQ1_9STRA|nr:hypothetical protein PsorP6_002125 [Peronosclerospora sorghi]